MQDLATQLLPLAQWLLRNSLQASVLICLILLVRLLARKRMSPRLAYGLWLLLLIRLIVPWAPASKVSVYNYLPNENTQWNFSTFDNATPKVEAANNPIPTTSSPASTETIAPLVIEPTPPPTDFPAQPTETTAMPISHLLVLIWLGGGIVLAIYVALSNFNLWWIVKSRRPLTDQKVLDLLEDCKSQMAIQTILAIVPTDRVNSPALFGFVRPRLLLPTDMLKNTTLDELRYIFLHELAHLKRYDILQGWLMAILQVLHWFNPLIWLAFAWMRTDRELACDALALSRISTDEPTKYGQTIVSLLERFSKTQYIPSMAGILENKAHLKRRITMIANFKKSSYKISAAAIVLFLVLGCISLTNAQSTAEPKSTDPVVLAQQFVELLVQGKFAQATKDFDATMKKALPSQKLAEVWKATTESAAPFKKQLGIRKEKYLSYDIVLVTCEFAQGPLDVKVVYDHKKQITGLFFVPTPQDVLERYQKSSDRKTATKTTDVTKQQGIKEGLEIIVTQAVLLISTCAETDPRVAPALESLQGLDNNAAVKELSKYLDSDKNTIRRSAIYVLWKGPFDDISLAVPTLNKLCSHQENYTRGMAALALGNTNEDSSFKILCDMTLDDKDGFARRCAAYALGPMGRTEAKPILEKALKDSDFNVRNNAEAAMTMLSQKSPTSKEKRTLTGPTIKKGVHIEQKTQQKSPTSKEKRTLTGPTIKKGVHIEQKTQQKSPTSEEKRTLTGPTIKKGVHIEQKTQKE